MNKAADNKKNASLWFAVVDILIILLLAGFIASLFLVEKTGGGDDEDPEVERLTFAVAVEEPYDVSLFLQEGKGTPIPLRMDEGENSFGWLTYGDDGLFYVECARSQVRASEDLDGLWYIGDTMLLNGTVLAVRSELADFSVTLLSLPTLMLPGTAGTTEEAPPTESDPESLEEPVLKEESDEEESEASSDGEDTSTEP